MATATPSWVPPATRNYDAENQAVDRFIFQNKRQPTPEELVNIGNTLYGQTQPGTTAGTTSQPVNNPAAVAPPQGNQPAQQDPMTLYTGLIGNYLNQPSFSSQLNTMNAQSAKDLGLPGAQQDYLGMLDPTKATPAGFNDSYAGAVNDFTKNPATDALGLQAQVNKIGALGAQNESALQNFTIQKNIAAKKLEQTMQLYANAQQMNAQGLQMDRQSKENLATMLFNAVSADRLAKQQEAQLTGVYNGKPTLDGQLKIAQLTGTLPVSGADKLKAATDAVASGLAPDIPSAMNMINQYTGQGALNAGSGVQVPNNNLFGIKYGNFAQQFGAQPGSAATDGGNFANFQSVGDSIKAANALLQGPGYKNLTPQDAVKRWSNNGAYAQVNAVPGTDPTKPLSAQPENINNLVAFIGSHEQPTQWAAIMNGSGQPTVNAPAAGAAAGNSSGSQYGFTNPNLDNYVIKAASGQPYIDLNKVPDAMANQVKIQAANAKIPIIKMDSNTAQTVSNMQSALDAVDRMTSELGNDKGILSPTNFLARGDNPITHGLLSKSNQAYLADESLLKHQYISQISTQLLRSGYGQNSVDQIFPTYGDSADVASAKLANIRQVLADRLDFEMGLSGEKKTTLPYDLKTGKPTQNSGSIYNGIQLPN